MLVDILSLFPSYFKGPFDESMIKRARERGLVEIRQHDIRDFAEGKHRKVDERPYGGGPGMVMMVEPVVKAIANVRKKESKVVFLSPQGKTLTAKKCEELSKSTHLILLCGHYEGVDQRAIDAEVDEEISIGDYVVSNGCLPAIVLLDATLRFLPGFLGHERAAAEDSFQNALLDWPQYTRPPVFNGVSVPEVLMSGDHKKINEWRRKQAAQKTEAVRPDLKFLDLEKQ